MCIKWGLDTPLYLFAKQILPKLKISIASIKYYGSLVDYYNVYKLKRMDSNKVTIYLLCFIFYRYRRTIDHLVECFIHHVTIYTSTAKCKAKEASQEQQANHANQLRKAAKILEVFTIDKLDACLFSEIKLKVYEFVKPPFYAHCKIDKLAPYFSLYFIGVSPPKLS